MPTVVNTDTSAARNSTLSIRRSRITRARRRVRRRLAGSCRTVDVACPGATADTENLDCRVEKAISRVAPAKSPPPVAAALELRFALEQLFDRHADFRHPAEHRALLALLSVLEGGR